MTLELNHKKGRVTLEPLDGGRSMIRVFPLGSGKALHTWCTSYPPDLVEAVLRGKGPLFLCDEIRRDEDPHYTAGLLELSISVYTPNGALNGKRILDFGCGSGASTMILARMFDRAEIVGLERSPTLLEIARLRAGHYGAGMVSFRQSLSDDALPENLGRFDCVLLNAVFEHLLPEERRTLLPQLWSRLRPGGMMFINETPDRRFPIETHTTGLPFINYLPDRLALTAARLCSRRVQHRETWPRLLRRGVRGGSPKEVLRLLVDQTHKPRLLSPMGPEITRAGQIWLHAAARRPLAFPEAQVVRALLLLSKGAGLDISPYLCLAIQKES